MDIKIFTLIYRHIVAATTTLQNFSYALLWSPPTKFLAASRSTRSKDTVKRSIGDVVEKVSMNLIVYVDTVVHREGHEDHVARNKGYICKKF